MHFYVNRSQIHMHLDKAVNSKTSFLQMNKCIIRGFDISKLTRFYNSFSPSKLSITVCKVMLHVQQYVDSLQHDQTSNWHLPSEKNTIITKIGNNRDTNEGLHLQRIEFIVRKQIHL